MKALFGYIGGKTRISPQIINNMIDHEIYVEPFFGSGAVFFKKGYKKVTNSDNYREVIGDLDYNVVNFFEQLRQNPDKIIEYLESYEYSEKMHQKSKTINEYYQNANNIQKASLFIFNLLSSFGSDLNRGFAYCKKGRNNVQTIKHKIEEINQYKDRLRDCYIFHKDYKTLIERFDTSKTLFYLDPPYKNISKYNIQKENEFDYTEFIEKIKNIKGYFILSHYKDEYILENFKEDKYTIIDINHKPSIAKGELNKDRYIKEGSNECIVLNYNPKDVNLWTGEEYKNLKKTLDKRKNLF